MRKAREIPEKFRPEYKLLALCRLGATAKIPSIPGALTSEMNFHYNNTGFRREDVFVKQDCSLLLVFSPWKLSGKNTQKQNDKQQGKSLFHRNNVFL